MTETLPEVGGSAALCSGRGSNVSDSGLAKKWNVAARMTKATASRAMTRTAPCQVMSKPARAGPMTVEAAPIVKEPVRSSRGDGEEDGRRDETGRRR